jgi:acyl-CoA thioesterase II
VPEDFPRPSDVELLGLDLSAGLDRCRFTLVPGVARHDGTLYGGTAIAVSVAAMEAATQRPALWVTTQYVATANQGDVIECTAEVLAHGRTISQVQVTGRLGTQVLFVSIGSTALPREGGLEGQYESAPHMTSPEDNGPMQFGMGGGFRGFTVQVEYRQAQPLGDEDGAAPLSMWAHLAGGQPFTPAGISFVADMVPGAIARSAGLIGGGASLDNSLRFGPIEPGEDWVLLELRAHMATGAHAHGSVHVWSRQGRLLAVGGQSANMRNMMSPEEFEQFGALASES